MDQGSDSDDRQGSYASSPCMAAELAPNYFDPGAVDPAQVRDVTRWRKAERLRLREARASLDAADRRRIQAALSDSLEQLLKARPAGLRNVVSFYWPIKNEPDLRGLMRRLHDSGTRIALPVVEVRSAPLVFREWTPETRMVRGHWNIPVPADTAPKLLPDLVLAPLMGWDGAGYRLGYGGGYFDRTLAAFAPRPFAIGIGLASARLATIYPQPHDIPMDVILTEDGLACERVPDAGS